MCSLWQCMYVVPILCLTWYNIAKAFLWSTNTHSNRFGFCYCIHLVALQCWWDIINEVIGQQIFEILNVFLVNITAFFLNCCCGMLQASHIVYVRKSTFGCTSNVASPYHTKIRKTISLKIKKTFCQFVSSLRLWFYLMLEVRVIRNWHWGYQSKNGYYMSESL